MKAEGIALVTGGGRGLGRAIALELARRGFEVVAGVRRPEAARGLEAEAAGEGLRLRLERLDVTAPETMRVPAGLRVLVNNAGIDRSWLPVEHMPLAEWRELFETHLFGLLEITRRAIPVLRAARAGVICNVTSCSILAPMPLFAAYRASKAAVSALGESLAVELAPFGVRVLEIQPGAIRTDMLAAVAEEPAAVSCEGYEELARRVHEMRAPSAELGVPAEDAARAIADAILDDASPLRRGCDPMSEAMLGAWRQGGDEQRLADMIRAFAGPREEGS